ncbi:hypothetical protein HK103_005014 [Boothiomyces macroporosus]|uniref:Uncharacterized protein n=1 Tax=Boothiomyces macroporosus TaxID=261099 RepID=A0AAD5Y7U1_9FUNG|nr:hypothetical protein HK103_005014 [Boothiomyces macroporosus]
MKLNTTFKPEPNVMESHEMAFTPVTNSIALGTNGKRQHYLKANSSDILGKGNEILATKEARSTTISTPTESSTLLKEQTASPHSRYSQASHRQSVVSITNTSTLLPRNVEKYEIISALLLSRTIYIPIAETANISFISIIHFILIYLAFSTAIQTLFRSYNEIENKSGNYLYSFLRYIILFGLGWTAPSIFSTVNNTLSNFAFFLIAARLVYCIHGLALAKTFTRGFKFANPNFINSVISVAPLAPWILTILLTNYSQSYTLFWISIVVDLAIITGTDTVNLAFIPAAYEEFPQSYLTIWMERWKYSSTAMTGIGIVYLVENNMVVGYPELYTSVKFNIIHFIWTCIALAILYSINSLYHSVIRPNNQNTSLLKGQIALVALKWIHVLILLLFTLMISLLKIATNDLNSPELQKFYLPMNMTLFGMEFTQISATPGLSYLQEFTSLLGAPRILYSAIYLQVLIGCLGVYLICLAAVCKILRLIEETDTDPYILYPLTIIGTLLLVVSILPIYLDTFLFKILYLIIGGVLFLAISFAAEFYTSKPLQME